MDYINLRHSPSKATKEVEAAEPDVTFEEEDDDDYETDEDSNDGDNKDVAPTKRVPGARRRPDMEEVWS